MIDSGDSPDFRPSDHIRHELNRDLLDYLFVTNADQDHLSDLKGLENAGIQIGTLFRNPSPDADVLRGIKEQQGELTQDIERFLELHRTYVGTPPPFEQNMGGISVATFFNRYPRFTDTNNLSLAVFFRFGSFKILFPGDLEEQGWLALLEQPAFRQELADTTVLVAAHHGRESGYSEEIFQYFTPHAIVMSDKAIIHDTQQMARTYHAKTRARGVRVRRSGSANLHSALSGLRA